MPKKDINDINVQLKDFFRSGDLGKAEYPQNPHNMLYMVSLADSSFFHNKKEKEILKELIQKRIDEKENIAILKFPSSINDDHKYNDVLKKIMLDENLVIKRMEHLVNLGADIKEMGIAITRIAPLAVLEKAVELGMDINYQLNGNNPLRNALKRRRYSLVNYLWNLPNINKDIKDNDGHGILQALIGCSHFELIVKVWNNDKHHFYSTDGAISDASINFLELVGKPNLNIPKKYINPIKEMASDLLTIAKEKNIETYNKLLETYKILKEIDVERQYKHLNQVLEKNDNEKTMKVKI